MKKMTIGIFAPSSPAHILFASKYKYAKSRLLELGFNVKEGNLIQNKNFQGYRTASGKERANELMNLILDEDIDILMPVIGGYNSASLLPYLDFDKIKNIKKILCGYS
ncbi:MAG: LD-carboxypeptidase, partial [Cetobacterium sp.]